MTRTWLWIWLTVLAPVPALAADALPAAEAEQRPIAVTTLPTLGAPMEASRGPILPVLYGTYGALQTYDALSTIGGVRRGAVEANPLMSTVATRPAAIWAVKAGVAAATVTMSERLWRQGRRKQAIVMMIAANGVMAAVATYNASVVRNLK